MSIYLIATALAVGSGPATGRALPLVETLERTPALAPSATRVPLVLERKRVFDIPSSIVRLARPTNWSPPVMDPAGSPSALRVTRNCLPMPNACATFYDTIDLIAVRRNNFRLVGSMSKPCPRPATRCSRLPRVSRSTR